jgi:hypothetical protein
MQRLPHWQLHLDALLCSRLHAAFDWGTFDCCLFAADCVLAVTGVDPAEQYRGYRGARAGLRVLERAGGVGLVATRALGFPRRMDTARVGDIVLVPADTRDREALAVVIAPGVATLPGPRGLVHAPLSVARYLWAVG